MLHETSSMFSRTASNHQQSKAHTLQKKQISFSAFFDEVRSVQHKLNSQCKNFWNSS